MTNSLIDTKELAAAPSDPDDGPEVAGPDCVGARAADPADPRAETAPADPTPSRRRRTINVGIRSLVVGIVIAVLLGAVATLAWMYLGAHRQIDSEATESANRSRAERIALDYAVNAATMNFKDLKPWQAALVAGTSPELNGKLTEAAKSMEQIVIPLEWTSTAEPLVAKVRSDVDGTFVVDSFVSVQTKTVQAAEPLQSTATYSVTIDSNNAWQITDVGGVGKVAGPK